MARATTVPPDEQDRDRLPRGRGRSRGHRVHRRPRRGLRRRRRDRRPPAPGRRPLERRLPVRPPPPAGRLLRRQLAGARVRHDRRDRPQRRRLRAGHGGGDPRVLRPRAGLARRVRSGPVLRHERLRLRRWRHSPVRVAAHRRGDDGHRPPEAGRRDVPRDVGAVDAHAVVRGRRGRAHDPRERAREAGRRGERVHDHRRGQDRDGRVHLADRRGGRPRPDPLGPTAGLAGC